MEVPGKHRVDEKTCWKDTKKHIGKDGELLESSWGVFWRAHSIDRHNLPTSWDRFTDMPKTVRVNMLTPGPQLQQPLMMLKREVLGSQ
jgi:hypothetical protein